jgi:Na+/phosphate symporter
MDEKVRDERILQEHDLQKIGNGICKASQEQDLGGNNSRIINNDICEKLQEQSSNEKSNLRIIYDKLQEQDLDRQCNLQTIRDNVYKKLQEQIDKKRKISTLPAPACGLYLSRVYY